MATNNYTLVIGDKNISSWSLRPWLAMKQCGIPFAEECIRLRQPDSKAEILRHSPSGKVPALKTSTGVVWDSLAILDYLAERHPEHKLWPEDEEARAVARSIAAEMHAGFAALRNDMSMDLLSTLPSPPMSDALEADIGRIATIWKDTRARFGQGGRSCSVRSRLPTPCTRRWRRGSAPTASTSPASATTAPARAYAAMLLALPAMAEWTEGAKREVKQRLGRLNLMVNPFLTPVPHPYSNETGKAGRLLPAGKDWLSNGSRRPLAAPAPLDGARASRHHSDRRGPRWLHPDRLAVFAPVRRAQALG